MTETPEARGTLNIEIALMSIALDMTRLNQNLERLHIVAEAQLKASASKEAYKAYEDRRWDLKAYHIKRDKSSVGDVLG